MKRTAFPLCCLCRQNSIRPDIANAFRILQTWWPSGLRWQRPWRKEVKSREVPGFDSQYRQKQGEGSPRNPRFSLLEKKPCLRFFKDHPKGLWRIVHWDGAKTYGSVHWRPGLRNGHTTNNTDWARATVTELAHTHGEVAGAMQVCTVTLKGSTKWAWLQLNIHWSVNRGPWKTHIGRACHTIHDRHKNQHYVHTLTKQPTTMLWQITEMGAHSRAQVCSEATCKHLLP